MSSAASSAPAADVVRVRVLAAAIAIALTAPVQAATYTVTNINDSAPSTPGSLRRAIEDANANPGPDQVEFAPGVSGTINLAAAAGEIVIDDSVTITGPGRSNLTVDAGGNSRIFFAWNPLVSIKATLSGLTLSGGDATPSNGFGGAILFGHGELTVLDSEISGNTAESGGGIAFYGDQAGDRLTVQDSTISGNTVNHSGSGLSGGGGITQFDGSLTVSRSIISGNTAASSTDSVWGGGINFIFGYGSWSKSILIEDSTISGNSASTSGADDVCVGGGIAIWGGADTTVRNSTISGNQVTTSGNSANAFAGGMMLYGLSSNGVMTVRNSTISGNSVQSRMSVAHGGGLLLWGEPTAIHNTTVTGNSATGVLAHGGGVSNTFLANTDIRNSIVAGNSAATNGNDLSGNVNVGFSLIQDPAAATITEVPPGSNITGQDPLLGPLADNGGPTQTHALPQNSPAVDTGDPVFNPNTTTPPNTDQRGTGYPRILQGRVDMGAYEYGVAPPVPSPVPSPIPSLGQWGFWLLSGLLSLLGGLRLRQRQRT